MSQYTLPGTEQDICANETASSRVVVARLQIVPTGLGIIDVATIAERVELLQFQILLILRQQATISAPRIVAVLNDRSAAAFDQARDIALTVADVVERFPLRCGLYIRGNERFDLLIQQRFRSKCANHQTIAVRHIHNAVTAHDTIIQIVLQFGDRGHFKVNACKWLGV